MSAEPPTGMWSPTRGHTLKENGLLFQQKPSTVHSSWLRMGAQSHLPLHAGMLTGLIMCRSYVGNYSCCEFMRATVCGVQKTLLHTNSPELLDLTVFWDVPVCARMCMGKEPGGGGGVSHLWLSTSETCSACWPTVSFCINNHLLHWCGLKAALIYG